MILEEARIPTGQIVVGYEPMNRLLRVIVILPQQAKLSLSQHVAPVAFAP
jgi:hypothetical protein